MFYMAYVLQRKKRINLFQESSIGSFHFFQLKKQNNYVFKYISGMQ